jgi:hypothetical protein
MVRAFIVFLFVTFLGGVASAQISWEIENRFRVLDGTDQQTRFERDLANYKYCAGIPLTRPKPLRCKSISLHELSLENTRVPYATLWDSPSYTFKKKIRSKERAISVSLRGAQAGERCTWLIGGKVKKNLGSCSKETLDPVELGQHDLEVKVYRGGSERKLNVPQTAKIHLKDILIVSLGDSFASGEGNPHEIWRQKSAYETELAPVWWERRCHRSLLSGATQGALKLARMNPDTSVTFLNYGCSGATLKHGLLGEYFGVESVEDLSWPDQAPPPRSFLGRTLEAQVTSVSEDLCLNCKPEDVRKPDVVVVSIGGNDIGFSSIVATVLGGCETIEECDQKSRDTIQERGIPVGADGIPGLIKAMRRNLTTQMAPKIQALGARAVLVPEYIDPTRDRRGYCDDRVIAQGDRRANRRATVYSGFRLLGFGARAKGTEFAHTKVLLPLNAAISDAAKQHGWIFVDGIMPKNDPKGVCSTSSWFLTYPQSNWMQYSGHGAVPTGTMHPNVFGHANIGEHLHRHFEAVRKAIP